MVQKSPLPGVCCVAGPRLLRNVQLAPHLLLLASAEGVVSFVLFAVLCQAGQLPAMAATPCGSGMLRTRCGSLFQLKALLMLPQEAPSPPDTVTCSGC